MAAKRGKTSFTVDLSVWEEFTVACGADHLIVSRMVQQLIEDWLAKRAKRKS